jgi:epsin
MIYRRFTEKAAEEWRQIYKALQLLEFLIKHGSERVIDDARGHISLLKMLRQFHFIDQNGKDQGINVRNRAKELAELLSDVDRIRSERKKARATKNKYTGVEGGATFGGGFSSGSSGRYGGFGSESADYGGGSSGSTNFGGYSGGVYGDGGGFGGQSDDWREGGGSGSGSRADRFEEYDEFDEDERPAPASRAAAKRPERAPAAKKAAEPPKKKEPEVDLFSFDDTAPASSSAAPAASSFAAMAPTNTAAASAPADDEDEFDDFQSATPAAQPAASSNFAQTAAPAVTSAASTTAHFAAPQPQSAPQQADISQMVSMASISPANSARGTPGVNYSAFSIPAAAPAAAPAAQQGGFQSGPNYFGTVQAQPAKPASVSGLPGMSSASNTPTTMANMKPVTSPGVKPPAAGGDAFGALWGKASAGIKKSSTPTAGPTMGQLAKEKSSAGIWGAPSAGSSSGNAAPKTGGSAMDDLLG